MNASKYDVSSADMKLKCWLLLADIWPTYFKALNNMWVHVQFFLLKILTSVLTKFHALFSYNLLFYTIYNIYKVSYKIFKTFASFLFIKVQ